MVLWAPFLLPSTCVLPAQKERIFAKKRATQQASVEQYGSVYQDIMKQSTSEKDLKTLLGYEGSNAVCGYVILHVLRPDTDFHTRLLGQSQRTFGIKSLPLSRIRRHLGYIAQDDALLLQEGLGERLTDSELREALEERGM